MQNYIPQVNHYSKLVISTNTRGAPDIFFCYPAGAGYGRIIKSDIRPEPEPDIIVTCIDCWRNLAARINDHDLTLENLKITSLLSFWQRILYQAMNCTETGMLQLAFYLFNCENKVVKYKSEQCYQFQFVIYGQLTQLNANAMANANANLSK